MSEQMILVVVLISAAAGYLLWRAGRLFFVKKGGCGSGCGGCGGSHSQKSAHKGVPESIHIPLSELTLRRRDSQSS